MRGTESGDLTQTTGPQGGGLLSGVNPVRVCAGMCFELLKMHSTLWGHNGATSLSTLKEYIFKWGVGVAAVQIVLQTSLGCCGLLSEAFSWRLSVKSPSETEKERKRKKGPSLGPDSWEAGSTGWKQYRHTKEPLCFLETVCRCQ